MTAMNTLPDAMPKHDSGMLDLRELGRTLVETLVNEIMAAQADMLCEGGGLTPKIQSNPNVRK